MVDSTAPPSSPTEFADLARDLVETHGVLPTVRGVVHRATQVAPCDWAAVAVTDTLTDRPARLSASTDPGLAAVIARIAAAAGASPGITAFQEARVVSCPDLSSAPQYEQYAPQMLAKTPVRAVLSLPLRLGGPRPAS